MHIKDYPTHPEKIELKGISDETIENFIENRYENLQQYTKYTKKNPKQKNLKILMHKRKQCLVSYV